MPTSTSASTAERVREIRATHEPLPLAQAVREEMRTTIAEAQEHRGELTQTGGAAGEGGPLPGPLR